MLGHILSIKTFCEEEPVPFLPVSLLSHFHLSYSQLFVSLFLQFFIPFAMPSLQVFLLLSLAEPEISSFYSISSLQKISLDEYHLDVVNLLVYEPLLHQTTLIYTQLRLL